MTSHGAVPDDLIPPLRRLELAREDLAERARLHDQLRRDNLALDRALAAHQHRRDELTREQLDVERLERVSVLRLWSSLRGTREEDLERERAEADAADAALTAHANVVEHLRDRLAGLSRRAAQLEGADAEYVAALEGVAGSGGAVDEVHVREAVGELNRLRELREVEQARVAGRSALQALLAAKEKLDSADAWSGWDTFGGGGMLSSAFKHEALDEARQRMGLAAEALDRFTGELDDIHVPGIALPEISGMTRGLDIWWDNIFTDLAVRDTIKKALRDVHEALDRVEQTLASLDLRREQLVGRSGGSTA
ncbi:hypothetical protein [Terrabacter sp. 2RAF25]|uniref:hypothetical protein n=1 Tax=Terrabacter sp. 2RAF25 TaxID=3232998 RepID=UPI003F946FAA